MCHTAYNICFVIKRLWIYNWVLYVIVICITVWFISIIIPQTSCCFLYFLLYSSKLYIGITTSNSSALSVFTPLIFEMQLINGAFFLETNFFSPSALSFAALVAVALAALLLGASKSSAGNGFFISSNSSFYNNICIRIIT